MTVTCIVCQSLDAFGPHKDNLYSGRALNCETLTFVFVKIPNS